MAALRLGSRGLKHGHLAKGLTEFRLALGRHLGVRLLAGPADIGEALEETDLLLLLSQAQSPGDSPVLALIAFCATTGSSSMLGMRRTGRLTADGGAGWNGRDGACGADFC